MLVDIHAHLHFKEFENDLDEVIERARKAGVTTIINSGTSSESNKLSMELSKKYDIVKPSFGLYPIEALSLNVEKELEYIKKNKNNIIAIGEVGLDYQESEDRKMQKEIFIKIIELAEKIKKPLILHTRKAEADVLEILESAKIKNAILHCFSGNMKLVNKAHGLGCYFSIPPVIARLEHFQSLVKLIPSTRLLTETDSPYLSPIKEKRNEPANVKKSVEEISKIKKIEYEEAEKIIFSNFQKIFLK